MNRDAWVVRFARQLAKTPYGEWLTSEYPKARAKRMMIAEGRAMYDQHGKRATPEVVAAAEGAGPPEPAPVESKDMTFEGEPMPTFDGEPLWSGIDLGR